MERRVGALDTAILGLMHSHSFRGQYGAEPFGAAL
jgi:hypothetical protein